jgi:hypothetical protein
MGKALLKICFLLLTFLLSHQFVQAQKKVTASLGIWPEIQISYKAGDNGLFFFRNQYRINTDPRFNDFRESGLLSNFEQIQINLGYEHTLTEHWRGGGIFRYAAENYPSTSFYNLFIRHTGAVKSLYFTKQFATEYVMREDQDPSARILFLSEVGKRLTIKQHTFTPAISYEAAVFSQLKKKNTTAEERMIDRTRLRMNVTWEASSKLFISTYFMRQTEFYYVEIPPVYNEDDILVTNGYRTKRNRITPLVGFTVNYNINSQVQPASIAY